MSVTTAVGLAREAAGSGVEAERPRQREARRRRKFGSTTTVE